MHIKTISPTTKKRLRELQKRFVDDLTIGIEEW